MVKFYCFTWWRTSALFVFGCVHNSKRKKVARRPFRKKPVNNKSEFKCVFMLLLLLKTSREPQNLFNVENIRDSFFLSRTISVHHFFFIIQLHKSGGNVNATSVSYQNFTTFIFIKWVNKIRTETEYLKQYLIARSWLGVCMEVVWLLNTTTHEIAYNHN